MKLISDNNDNFFNKLKKSHSEDILKRNKKLYEEQRDKNLQGIDLKFTNFKEKRDQYLKQIFSEVRRSEEEAKRKSRKVVVKPVVKIAEKINNKIEKVDNDEIYKMHEDDISLYNKNLEQSRKLWSMSNYVKKSKIQDLNIDKDILKNMNQKIINNSQG